MPAQSAPGIFINPQYILNAASFAPGGYPISPGGFITLAGSGFSAQSGTAQTFPWPLTLAGVSMTVNGTPAPLYQVNGGIINALVPYEVTGSTATIQITVNNTKSNSVIVPLSATAPGIFSVPPNGISNGAMRHLDATLVNQALPAARGEYISIYLTGLGATNPTVADGAAAPGNPTANVTAPVAVYIGGEPVTNIEFQGLTPTLAGLYQLNIQIPDTAASGAQSLAVQTNQGFTDMVTIWIQ